MNINRAGWQSTDSIITVLIGIAISKQLSAAGGIERLDSQIFKARTAQVFNLPGNRVAPEIEAFVIGICLVGFVIRLDHHLQSGDNIGYMIPTTIIHHFLKDIEDKTELGDGSDGIDPLGEDVAVTVGAATVYIPSGSFVEKSPEFYRFNGDIGGVEVLMTIKPLVVAADTCTPTTSCNGRPGYYVHARLIGVDLTGTPNPVTAEVHIGDDKGAASIRPRGWLRGYRKDMVQ